MKTYYLNCATRHHLCNYSTSLEISFLWFVCLFAFFSGSILKPSYSVIYESLNIVDF